MKWENDNTKKEIKNTKREIKNAGQGIKNVKQENKKAIPVPDDQTGMAFSGSVKECG